MIVNSRINGCSVTVYSITRRACGSAVKPGQEFLRHEVHVPLDRGRVPSSLLEVVANP